MPGTDGFGIADVFGADALPVIIFVTAFDEHAVRAFDSCALDYLLKPVSPARLEKALVRANQQLARLKSNPPFQDVIEPTSAKRFCVRSGQRTSFIAAEEIDWIESDGNYAVLHLGAQNHLLRATMSALEMDLPKHFVRTSRSAIVNLRRVKELQTTDGNHFAIMQDGARAPITSSVRDLQDRLREL